MMRPLRPMLCLMLLAAGLAAPAMAATDPDADEADYHGPLTATFGIASGETFRGVTVPSDDPVIRGTLDYQFKPGFYVGAAAANSTLPGIDAEADLSAGWRRKDGPLSWDLGVVYYSYYGTDRRGSAQPDYGEVDAQAAWDLKLVTLSGDITVTPPGFGHSKGAAAVSAGLEVPFDLTDDLSGAVSGNAGFQNERGVEDYAFWDAGVSLYLNWFDVDLRYYATDTREAQLAARGFHSGHGQWIAAVSKTF